MFQISKTEDCAKAVEQGFLIITLFPLLFLAVFFAMLCLVISSSLTLRSLHIFLLFVFLLFGFLSSHTCFHRLRSWCSCDINITTFMTVFSFEGFPLSFVLFPYYVLSPLSLFSLFQHIFSFR